MEESLDLSLIQSQPPATKSKQNQLDKDISLENILDELNKQDNPLKKKAPAPYIEISKNPVLQARSPKDKPVLLLLTDQILEHEKIPQKGQTTRRDSKGLIAPLHHTHNVRPSIEALHDTPELDQKNNLMGSGDSPDLKKRRGSHLLVNNDLTHVRRLSSPNVFGLLQLQSPQKFPNISTTFNGSQSSISQNMPNGHPEPRFNVSIPEKLQMVSPVKLGSAYSFTNSPKSPHLISPTYIHPKIESPMQGPISNDYLIRVLQKTGGGSHPASNSESPKSDGNPSAFGHVKRGSFSVFRKIVEAELVKNG